MHLVGDDQKRPNKQRTTGERYFKRLNNILMATQFACYLIVFSSVVIAMRKTIGLDSTTLDTQFSFRLTKFLASKTANCSFSTIQDVDGSTGVPFVINSRNQAELFVELMSRINFCLGINGMVIIVGAINKLFFDLNKFHVRIRHLYFHKDVVTTTEILLLAVCYKAAVSLEPRAALLRQYLQFCGIRSQSSIPFTVPFTPIYVSLAFTIGLHFLSVLIFLSNTLRSDFGDEDFGDAGDNTVNDDAAFEAQRAAQIEPPPEAVMPRRSRNRRDPGRPSQTQFTPNPTNQGATHEGN